MFEAVRNNKRIVQVFLALITLPFAFFGVESYMRSSMVGEDVAKIGDIKITQQDFQQTLREQQERLRGQMGAQFDPKLLETPQIRESILDDLITQRLLVLESSKYRLFASDDAVRRAIAAIDAFKVEGKFSSDRYEAVLRAQGMSPAGFEAQLRRDLTLQQLAGGFGKSYVLPQEMAARILAMQTEKREIVDYRLPLENYLGKVKLAEGAAKAYYDKNTSQFQTPEMARVEYLVLSAEAIATQLAVSDAEAKAWYDEQKGKGRYQVAEERRASHILVDKAKGKARAEEALAAVQKTPAAFAELAKKYSDDPGSANKGGDLGFFARGAMVKPFEDAVFAQKEGEVSGIVESEFGFHIIKLTGIHAGKEKPFADVKAEILDELRKNGASRKFAEAAEAFTNLVYEQPDSLKPAAEKFKLTVKQSDWIGRQANAAAGPLANEKILAALFSEDSIKSKRNTEAVEIAPNTLIAARIVDYKPAAVQPFETIQSNVEAMLKRQEAQAMAAKEGNELLEKLRKGEDKLAWGPGGKISRLEARKLPPQIAQVVFRMDAGKLPSYAGAELPGGGFGLFKLVRVAPGDKLDENNRNNIQQQLSRVLAQEEFSDYVAALRARYKVEINHAALESKER